MTIKLVGPRDCNMYSLDETFVNTTSRSNNWSKGLSPFVNGPIKLYDGAPCEEGKSFENVWQYAKVYSQHVDSEGNPSEEYFKWAKIGFLTARGERYPMGKGAKPLYSWWGEKLSYIEARKKIYIPLYSEAVKKTEAFAQLLELYLKHGELTLWDFDVYDYRSLGMTFEDVVNNDKKALGHGFVLEQLLLAAVKDIEAKKETI